MNFDMKKWAPFITALLLFIILPYIFADPLLDGKELRQGDIIKYEGMAKEIHDYRDTEGEEALWTGRAFSGMPAFTISVMYPTNIAYKIHHAISLLFPAPVNFIFLLCVGFFILLLSFRIDPWISIIGALSFGFASFFIISIDAGHNTKVLSIAYMPAIIGGIVLAFNKRYFIGGIIATLFVALQISAGHFQIIYYTALVAAITGIVYLIRAIRDKELPAFGKSAGILVIAALLGALPNFSSLYNTYVHSKESMRGGGSELRAGEDGGAGGLDIGYALDQWSLGIMESFTVMFANFEGGGSSESLEPGSPVHEVLNKYVGRPIEEPMNAPLYTGPQRFTSPIYFGATVIFLFMLGIFLLKGYARYWVIAATVLSFFIAWGSHFEIFNSFLFYNFPMFNKFRNPAMALSIAGMTMPLLGFLALNKLTFPNENKNDLLKALKFGAIATGVLFAVACFYGLTTDFKAANEAGTNQFIDGTANQLFRDVANNPQYQGQVTQFKAEFYDAILEARANEFWQSVLRSFILIALVAGLIYFFLKGKIKQPILLAGIGILVLFDVWGVSSRYLTEESFADEAPEQAIRMSPADQAILQDRDLSYRVLNLTSDVFSDGFTPYYHKSIFGYSAAKIQLYQDLIENQLGNEVQKVYGVFQSATSQQQVDQAVRQQLPVMNMLNTRYFILSPEAGGVYRNPNALGNAWFVSNVQFVQNAREEMERLSTIDPAQTALIRSTFKEQVQQQYQVPPDASIQLTQYKPNHLVYTSNNRNEGLAVFSEVYYQTGWNAYVDGKQVPIVKANYVLRAIEVPAGQHKIEMIFEPESYKMGNNVSLAGSVLFVLFIFGSAFMVWRKRKKAEK